MILCLFFLSVTVCIFLIGFFSLTLHYLIMSYRISCRLVLSKLTLHYLVSSCLALSYLILFSLNLTTLHLISLFFSSYPFVSFSIFLFTYLCDLNTLCPHTAERKYILTKQRRKSLSCPIILPSKYMR